MSFGNLKFPTVDPNKSEIDFSNRKRSDVLNNTELHFNGLNCRK